MRSQPRFLKSSSTVCSNPSKDDGVGDNFSRGRTLLEMVRTTGPYLSSGALLVAGADTAAGGVAEAASPPVGAGDDSVILIEGLPHINRFCNAEFAITMYNCIR